ncbi:MAG: response regulator [Elusimicrobiota bacterium]
MLKKILVVEDDLDIQGFAKTVLAAEGFEVDACATAADAYALFARNPPDLVVIDIGLPDGSGLDVCRKLGAGAKRRVPFIFLTAEKDLDVRLEAFKIGAQDYIQKPFAVQELLARVKVHMSVQQSHDDLAKRNHDLELMARARQDMTDMIVHDLKTPLTSIKGTIDLIKMQGLISTKAYGALIDHAGTAADFMLLMVNDLLDIGHSEAKGLPVSIAEFELKPMFDKLTSLFSSRASRAGVALEFSNETPSVSSDRNLLFRILVNLIGNAIKVSKKGNSIDVDVRRANGRLRVTVADRGTGVPHDLKQNIFDKYTTTDPGSYLEDGGSGIGLTFCRLAAQAMKGKIWVEDRPGGGSLFIVDLP